MRVYYFRHAHWSQGLLLGVLLISTIGQHFVEGGTGLSRQDVVRGIIAVILLPGIVNRAPTWHAVQAVLLLVVVVLGISYVSTPIS